MIPLAADEKFRKRIQGLMKIWMRNYIDGDLYLENSRTSEDSKRSSLKRSKP